MRFTFSIAILLFLILSLSACGADDSGDVSPDGDSDSSDETEIDDDTPGESDDFEEELEEETEEEAEEEESVPDPVVTPKCAKLEDGWISKFKVDGEDREFFLHLPAGIEIAGKYAVVFNWHGFGMPASSMANVLSGSVNNERMPFVLVTPADTGLMPTAGLDWAILQVDEDNMEARLFDEVLECLNQRYNIDETHVHSLGFSAGAIVTDMLGVTRGDVLASIISFSGVYFSNPEPANDSGLDNWIPLSTENKFVQMLVHGGAADAWNALRFDTAGENDVVYLNENGHDVIHCDHGGGHTIPMALGADQIIRFFADHPLGTENTPYADSELPVSFPAYCSVSSVD